ncbi:unnamed protein product [Paramecium primaurelia]|uniref:Casein kinase I n=1 Tax=Paramecium primaurelia TaxID=5886 RepID=A0A8S1MPC5_PARPR|nr:unnamed protein product [Paramecium primaurelia]
MMKLPPSYRDPKIFNNKYIIKQQISSGSFGIVYLAFDKHTREEVAVKIEKEENEDVSSLDREISILNRLNGVPGTPKLYWSGFEQDYNVIVIQILGKDLSQYIKQYKKFSLKSVLQISYQLLSTLQQVHEKGVIHRDFKPENILTGYQQENGTIYLVDYGVSKVYLDNHGKHMQSPLKDKKSFIGTTRYASIAAHRGYELGRKDDVESMFYVMIYLLKGKLPWQNLQNIGDRDRTDVVGEVKQKTEISELCKDVPSEFAEIFNYLKKLEFKSEPDYKYMLSLILKAATNNHIILDKLFEWTDRQTKIKDQMIWALSEEKQKLPQMNSSQQIMGSNNLLKPPEAMRATGGSPIRMESKHLTSTSIQGSLSSMMIKYIPSQVENTSMCNQDDKRSKSKKSKRSRKSAKSSKRQSVIFHSGVQIIEPKDQLRRHKTIDSTWGFQQCMNEFSGDEDSQKLSKKYHQLQACSLHPKKIPKNTSKL